MSNYLNPELSLQQLQHMLDTDPDIYKHCKLITKRHDLAYARPLSDPTLLITITGRDNVGRSLPGDEVCVQILSKETDGSEWNGKVVGLMQRDIAQCAFICKLEVHNDKQYATPIKNNMTRISVIPTNVKIISIREFQPTVQRWKQVAYKHVDKDQLLVVQVLKWEKHCKYPLGAVTKVFPTSEYLIQRFHIEKCGNATPPLFQPTHVNEGNEDREDFYDWTTFSIDSDSTEDLDDAISVADQGETYIIAVHITDVANYISKNSEEDKFAKHQGRTLYPPPGIEDKPAFMFSRELSSKYLSLIYDKNRKAISLVIVVDKTTGTMLSSRFALSVIRSDKQLSYKTAGEIIEKRCVDNTEPLYFSSVEDCVAVAYRFTMVHRRSRMEGKLSIEHLPGETRARYMVEELMNLYNSAVAEELLSSDLTKELTPLRCHPKPEDELLEQFKDSYSDLLPLSPCLSFLCEVEELENTHREDMSVDISATAFQKMKALAEAGDYDKLVQIITSDEINPKIYLMEQEFHNIQSKAFILRSCSNLLSKLGHFGLQLNAYTLASSPMRRYIDLVIQRLLHNIISGNQVLNYTKDEIEEFCQSGMEDIECDEEYNLDISEFIATSNKSVVTEMAVVVALSPQEITVSFPFKRASEKLSIMYRHLKVVKQPEYSNQDSEVNKSVTLQWERRVYSFNKDFKIRDQTKLQQNVMPIPVSVWRQIMSAVKDKDWNKVKSCLLQVNTAEPNGNTEKGTESDSEKQEETEHVKQFDMKLQIGDMLQVQVGQEIINGTTKHMVKLLNINPFFEVCLEHARNPDMYFCKTASQKSKSRYENCEEYQEIWAELCQMDTAYNAVEENNSVILEDVKITWFQKKNSLNGFFTVSSKKKKEWYLEFDLLNCFLCIRLRDQNVNKEIRSEAKQCDGIGLPDLHNPLPFTWVAHAIAKKPKTVKNEDEGKTNSPIKIQFQINCKHVPSIPATISEDNTRFTVEVIPKKIPYVLREQAVANLKNANDLVKSIATGEIQPSSSSEDVELYPVDLKSLDIKRLNESQKIAVKEALQNCFTVIQGPPGTGKTVVGVHITYQFYMKNKDSEEEYQKQTPKNKKADKKTPKKCGILYCGPSNKSVDIVAEQLLKLKGVLKPLRIYSDQMEMREFPYPGSDLMLSRQSLRDEKTKEELKDITLMYLVRKDDNPSSKEIKDFEEGITTFDANSYKKLLKKAQKYELQKHDVILCTCSAALKPILIKTMDFRQIIIDECAMAMEPEAFIPLVSHNPQQIVLLGDHKQVRPIVKCGVVKKLGMQTSLFERYMRRALMLNTQYRMHQSICDFPSKQFYEGKLITGARRGPCMLLDQNNSPTAILFGHVQGEEVRLVVSTKEGNEDSVENQNEAEEAVRVVRMLIHHSQVSPDKIAILTPYNAQVSAIKKILNTEGIKDVSVCTIMKSQGSEWPYVILSTVRSTPRPEKNTDDQNPDASLTGKNLGFLTHPNLINVAITRAQDGLCILGNQYLLKHNEIWGKLLSHYKEKHCLLNNAQDIQVRVQVQVERVKDPASRHVIKARDAPVR